MKPLSYGTTTVGIVAKDGVVLAADKRATAGYYIAHKEVVKIHKITDYIAITTAGLVADAQMLVEYLRAEASYIRLQTGREPSVKSIATLVSNILFSSRLFPYIVQFIIGGYDSKPRLFNLDLFGTLTEEKFVATGSGSPIAISILEELYNEDLTVEEAEKIAVKAVSIATRRDVASGNGVDVAVITKNGIEMKNVAKY